MSESVETRIRQLEMQSGNEYDVLAAAKTLMSEYEIDVRDTESEGQTPFGEQCTETDVANWIQSADQYRIELEKKRGAEIADLYNLSLGTPLRRKKRFGQDDLDHFFSESWAAADFVYWNSLSLWTEEEAIALSLGKSPEAVNLQELAPIPTVSPFRKEYERRLDVLKRSLAAKVLPQPIRPSEFTAWAQRQQHFEMPEALGSIAKDLKFDREASSDNLLSSKISALILALAVSYGNFPMDYDPKVKSKTFTDMENDFTSIGLPLDRKTISKYILLARDWAVDSQITVKRLDKPMRDRRTTKPMRDRRTT